MTLKETVVKARVTLSTYDSLHEWRYNSPPSGMTIEPERIYRHSSDAQTIGDGADYSFKITSQSAEQRAVGFVLKRKDDGSTVRRVAVMIRITECAAPQQPAPRRESGG
jgi:hypothetical protein